MTTLRRIRAELRALAHDLGLTRQFNPADYWSAPFPFPTREDH
jgi:hypothetical protein